MFNRVKKLFSHAPKKETPEKEEKLQPVRPLPDGKIWFWDRRLRTHRRLKLTAPYGERFKPIFRKPKKPLTKNQQKALRKVLREKYNGVIPNHG